MSESQKIGLFRHAKDVKVYEPGQTIFKLGEPPDLMYVVQEGEVEIVYEGNPVEVLGPGDMFGEMSLISDEPRSATAVAKTLRKLVPIDLKRFIFLVEETPYFAVQVMKVMASRIRRMLPRLR
jgi:CRP/FNR family transcriptional regulator, cyclic AMP receptor protein